MRKTLGIIAILWIFWFFAGNPASCVSGADIHDPADTAAVQSEVCSVSAALKCTDISSSGQNITTSLASPFRYIPRGITKLTFQADRCLHYICANTHPEWHDHNFRGQFSSSNLPYSICHLLI
jgi:hypothetical protein